MRLTNHFIRKKVKALAGQSGECWYLLPPKSPPPYPGVV